MRRERERERKSEREREREKERQTERERETCPKIKPRHRFIAKSRFQHCHDLVCLDTKGGVVLLKGGVY